MKNLVKTAKQNSNELRYPRQNYDKYFDNLAVELNFED